MFYALGSSTRTYGRVMVLGWDKATHTINIEEKNSRKRHSTDNFANTNNPQLLVHSIINTNIYDDAYSSV